MNLNCHKKAQKTLKRKLDCHEKAQKKTL